MDYKIEKLEKNKAKITVTLSTSEWHSEIEAAYNKHKSRFNVTGFRKGKAPRRVIEQHYGAGVFYEDAISDSFYKYYMDVLQKETQLQPIDNPSISIAEVNADALVVEAEVDLQPEVVVKSYKGFGIEVKPQAVDSAQVEEKMQELVEKHARFVEVEREAKNGDILNIDFVGSVDGVKFDGGASEGYDLELGSKSFIDTFEEQLVGVKTGDEKNVVVTFPTPYQAKDLEGKEAVFAVKVNAVKEKQLPELTDAFISDVSEFENLADYKKDVLEGLKLVAQNEARVQQQTKILERVLENTEVEIPQTLIERELDHILEDFNMRLMYQGLNIDAYLQYVNTTMEEFKAERRVDAEKNVKLSMALQYILNKENLNLTDEELDAKLAENAKLVNKSLQDYTKSLDDHRLGHIKNDILMGKLLEFLQQNN